MTEQRFTMYCEKQPPSTTPPDTIQKRGGENPRKPSKPKSKDQPTPPTVQTPKHRT